jgi:4-amino-4-deoxy-L-arabinose transferase-like glycosyltransferase
MPALRAKPSSSAVASCVQRVSFALAVGVCLLAAANLLFRLGSESLHEWDESLYATSAVEMLRSGHYVATTVLGELDYYNSKPPLNIWLIVTSFKLFGISLWALRVPAVLSAWLTVLLVMRSARRWFGEVESIVAGTVLATSFGFIYVHSGRSAETDALFTLLVTATAVVLADEGTRPWRRAWLGPVLAAAFLLRGMAVLMPMLMVGIVWVWRAVRERGTPLARLVPAIAAAALFALPVGLWAWARWQVDGRAFFDRMIGYDLVERSVSVIEGHPGGPFFYLNILAKHQYDWLLAAAVAFALASASWPRVRAALAFWRRGDLAIVLGTWALVALGVPTLMQTKLPWYLNTFYPLFAIAVSWIVARAVEQVSHADAAREPRRVLAGVLLVAGLVAEAKLVTYSYRYRDLDRTPQGVLLQERSRLAGHRIYRVAWDRAESFVARAVVEAEPVTVRSLDEFLQNAQPGDYWVSRGAEADLRLELVASTRRHHLYRMR